uniref:Uncharacterized protein n=1 Tax=viral metagenome TaxID=1070528 RepID=A0A6M3LSF0_9ZZZZ
MFSPDYRGNRLRDEFIGVIKNLPPKKYFKSEKQFILLKDIYRELHLINKDKIIVAEIIDTQPEGVIIEGIHTVIHITNSVKYYMSETLEELEKILNQQ